MRRPEEGWHRCSREVQDSPEYRAHLAEMDARVKALASQIRSEKLDVPAMREASARMQAIQVEMATQLTAPITERCGPRPDAAPGGESAGELPDEARLASAPLESALEAGRFSERQYGILKERIAPFCAAGIRADEEVRIPGSDGKFYVYSRSEARALAPRCPELGTLLRAVL